MVPDFSPVMPFLIGFFVLAGITALLTVVTAAAVVLGHRRTRLARRQDVRTYYGRLAFSH